MVEGREKEAREGNFVIVMPYHLVTWHLWLGGGNVDCCVSRMKVVRLGGGDLDHSIRKRIDDHDFLTIKGIYCVFDVRVK